jgi:hypothetical protein
MGELCAGGELLDGRKETIKAVQWKLHGTYDGFVFRFGR